MKSNFLRILVLFLIGHVSSTKEVGASTNLQLLSRQSCYNCDSIAPKGSQIKTIKPGMFLKNGLMYRYLEDLKLDNSMKTELEIQGEEFYGFELNDIEFVKINLTDSQNVENQCVEEEKIKVKEAETVLDDGENNNSVVETMGIRINIDPTPIHRVSGGSRSPTMNCFRDNGRNNNHSLPSSERGATPIPRVGGGTR
ncbi:hypothetical protein [Oxynema aestuarii]|uniref:Uncharacterized protein n=1 Tax=Oxynema aestuarii AP17 TaxID=2064643 RepID=A0A6H1U1B6_9CYAN|nr:hypothetical protein [Oxynema aestuarii]QIZ71409.1 hypothetical protein HCG48_13155 [Oxynema aestuarii AP17]